MKGKQLALLIIALVVLGGAALFLIRRDTASWSSTATRSDAKVLNFPVNDVSHLTIKSAGTEVNLAKKGEIWTVQERADYPADFTKVGTLVRKLWELKPVQDVKVGASQLGRLQLTQPGTDGSSSTLIDLKGGGDQRLGALLLGKTHTRESEEPAGLGGGSAAGRYVMAQDGSNRVYLVSETFDEAQTKPEQWLSRDFIKVENPRLITIAGSTPGTNWTMTRAHTSAQWELVDAKPEDQFDSTKATGLSTLLANASFTDVLPPDKAASETGLGQPATAHLETFDGFVYDLRIGKLDGENYPVVVAVRADLPKERIVVPEEKPEDKTRLDQEFQLKQKQLGEKLEKEQKLQNRTYLMSKAIIDQLLRDRTAFAAAPSPSPGAPAASPAQKAPTSPSPAPKGPSPSPTPTGKKKK